MRCPYSRVEKRYDACCESVLICMHPKYLSMELAKELNALGKTFVPNKECQFVGELNYEQCPLHNF